MPADVAEPVNPTLPDAKELRLVLYPDPLLKKKAKPVVDFTGETPSRLRAIGDRMLEMMRQHKGVGLAGPQAGLGVRIFVMNASGDEGDDRVYVNPVLTDAEGDEEAEEGCLSLPDVNTPVLRAARCKLTARDIEGNEVVEEAEGFEARVWQHEVDHLDGVLITDKMPPTARMAARKQLKNLEADYAKRKAGK